MDDLLAEFVAETREMLEAIGGELVAWEADPSDRARLDSIFRFVHTVKGNCGFFDFPRLEKLSHAAEDALAEVRAGRRATSPRLVTAVLAIADRIGEMIDAIEGGENPPERDDDILIAALEPDGDDEGEEIGARSDEAGPARAASGGGSGLQRSIRLPVALLDSVMSGVSDLVLARNDLARRLREAASDPALEGAFERLSTILGQVRESVTRMRMQRIEHLFGALPRLVRDLSAELGKQVMIDLEGGDVELDREMIEMIRDPLTHIVRNAIDHGIERPSERLAADKHEIGTLSFAARQSGNQISIVVTDDGRGLDTEKLARKAVAAGIYTQAEVDAMSERRRHYLVFEPGLSTADTVSGISGRGVGMDVVRANIERVGGSIDVSSKQGEGTFFYLKLPLTLSIVATLTVGSGGQRFAIPRSYVEEIVFGKAETVEFAEAGDRQLVTFRGRRVPCLSLAEVLGAGEESDWTSKTLVFARLATDDMFALAVDRVFDHEDIVVKPIAPAIMETRLYGGTTLLDDGSPMMLLDLPSIATMRRLISDVRGKARLVGDGEQRKAREKAGVPLMLFDGYDGRRRAVRMELVRRIERVAREAIDIDGERASAVVDGAIFPLVGLGGAEVPEGGTQLLRLSDGACELVYAVRKIVDSATVSDEMLSSEGRADTEVQALIDGRVTPLLDGHALFARHGCPPVSGPRLACRLQLDDHWSRSILQPLVEAVGYRVLAADDGEAADISIIPAEDGAAAATAGRLIRVRSDPDGGEDSIYRYDREGLVGALRAARAGR